MLCKGSWAQRWICWGFEGVSGHVQTKELDWMPWSSALLPPNTSLGWLDPAPPMPVFVGSACTNTKHTCYWAYCRFQTQGGLWCGQFSFSAPHTWTAASVQEGCDSSGSGHLRVWCLSLGLRGFPPRGTCCLFWSVLCAWAVKQILLIHHQGHRRAGWSPVKAVRMGCSSLCSCSALGQPASHSEGELLRCGDSKPLPWAFNF